LKNIEKASEKPDEGQADRVVLCHSVSAHSAASFQQVSACQQQHNKSNCQMLENFLISLHKFLIFFSHLREPYGTAGAYSPLAGCLLLQTVNKIQK